MPTTTENRKYRQEGSVDIDSKKIIFFLICLGNITISFNVGAVAAAIPYIAQDLGVSDLTAAQIVPSYMIPYGLGALLYAPLTKKFSYRRILGVAMAIYAFASLMAAVSGSLGNLLFAQIGAGIAAASSTPLSLMIIGDFFPKEVRGRLVGIYFGSSFLASTVGMFFMGWVPWRVLFLIPAFLGMVSCLSFYFLKIKELNKKHQESVNYLRAFFKKEIRHVFLFIFGMSFLYHAVHKWYGVYLNHDYGLSKLAVSWILIFVAVIGLLGQQVGGYLSDKKGRISACRTGILALSCGAVLLVGHYPVFILILILGLIGIGWTISHNSVSTLLTDFPDEDRPIVASLNSSVRFISGGLGFSLSKFFVEKSFGWTFFGIGVLLFAFLYFLKFIFSTTEAKA